LKRRSIRTKSGPLFMTQRTQIADVAAKESDSGDRARIRSSSDRNTASLNLEIGLKGVPLPPLSRFLLDD
jgi:hypothetical protein